MNKKIKQLLVLVFLSLLLCLPYFVFAASSTPSGDSGVIGKMRAVAEPSYEAVTSDSLLTYAGEFIAIILGMLGIIFVGLMIYAGLKWMMSAGDADDIKKAKATIRMAIIGLIVTVSAYALWKFIADYLL
ncbi:MAG: hypothetical protein NT165_02245 [Candidatus Falkowbacteria bacterium]|nr:hypothetical protein [Candidatus Falkowbacteria bacterium]